MQLGQDGQPDLAALARITISDAKHRVRSVKAEAITKKWEAQVKLPDLARNGGEMATNPNTKQQRRLSRGEYALQQYKHIL